MIYKVPCPTNTNGVRLFKEGNQIAVEYTRGEPHVTMAYDSVLGRSAHTVSFRQPSMHPDTQRIVADAQRKLRQVYGRDALPSGTGIQRSKSEMAPRGSMNINDQDPDDDDGYSVPQEVAAKVVAYLKDIVSSEDLEAVHAILVGGEEDDVGPGKTASDRGLAGRNARRQAMDAEFASMFPNALKILRR